MMGARLTAPHPLSPLRFPPSTFLSNLTIIKRNCSYYNITYFKKHHISCFESSQMTRLKNPFKRKEKENRTASDAIINNQSQATNRPASSPAQPNLASPSLASSGHVPQFPDGIKVWYDCHDATLDVCFVHGLTGNRDTTWTAHGEAVPWPPNLLPTNLPKARLLTFGKDAYVVRKTVASANRLADHARNLLVELTHQRSSSTASRPRIIFVAHSLGGLVCKDAILQSRYHPEKYYHDIFDSVIGIAFMGTPHRGSWMADWGKISASALGLVKSINKSILEILETDDELLGDIQHRFWSMVRERGQRLKVTCFFEELLSRHAVNLELGQRILLLHKGEKGSYLPQRRALLPIYEYVT